MGRLPLQAAADESRRTLKPRRFLHVLGVAHEAAALAWRHGADPEWAALAGLLHDRSKPLKPEIIEADLERWGRPLDPEDRPNPAIWHGPHAAEWLRREFGPRHALEPAGVEEAAEAIALHSTGGPEAGPLVKILFLADALEPGRDYEGIAEARALARRDLDGAYLHVLEQKRRRLEFEGKPVNLRALRALEAAKGAVAT